MCDYIAKGGKEILVSNRLRSIADVVLERVAEILGQFYRFQISFRTFCNSHFNQLVGNKLNRFT